MLLHAPLQAQGQDSCDVGVPPLDPVAAGRHHAACPSAACGLGSVVPQSDEPPEMSMVQLGAVRRAAEAGQAQVAQAQAQPPRAAAAPPAAGPSRRLVQVYAFDSPAQMRMMLFDWLLQGSLTLPPSPHDAEPIDIKLQSVGDLGEQDLRRAFEHASSSRPFLALWLFPFKDGDRKQVLPLLAELFEQSSRRDGVRHGVFHWTPEFCNGNISSVIEAYKYAEFVFMFGYLDKRLAKASEKYLPFPLGPAISRGWHSPPGPLRTTQERPLLASYRGSGTHEHESKQIHRALEQISPANQKLIVVEDRGSWTKVDSQTDHTRYLELMATSRFAISPGGHNPNTYRIAEAVESGAVPLLVTGATGCYSNWAGLYGLGEVGARSYAWLPRAPFAVIQSWSEVGTYLVARARETQDATPKLRAWYSQWRDAFSEQLSSRIRSGTTAPAEAR